MMGGKRIVKATTSTCLVLAFLLAACTPESTESTPTTAPASSTPSEDSASPSTESTTSTTEEGDAPASEDAAPLESYDEAPPTTASGNSTSAYISRVSMEADSIELTWSVADEGVTEYHLHRLPLTSEDKPDVSAMTPDNVIHVADDTSNRFTDDKVEAGTQYWYGIRELSDDGTLVAHGWHRADAVTDTEPPALVKELKAEASDGTVLVNWSAPDENYELHGYRVLRSVNGEEFEPLATTWRLEQTSFLDDDPPTDGQLTYAVVAFDFHWNDSAPAEITVDLAG